MHPWQDLPSSPLASSPASQGLLSVRPLDETPAECPRCGSPQFDLTNPALAQNPKHPHAGPGTGPCPCLSVSDLPERPPAVCLTEPGGGTGILAFQSGARGLVHGTSLGRTPLSRGLKGPPPHVELFPESSSSWDRMCGQDFLGHTGIGRDAGLIGPPTHAVSLAPLRLEGIRGPRNRHVLSSLF